MASRMSATVTRAPFSAIRRQVPLPLPLPLPSVTMTGWEWSWFMGVSGGTGRGSLEAAMGDLAIEKRPTLRPSMAHVLGVPNRPSQRWWAGWSGLEGVNP